MFAKKIHSHGSFWSQNFKLLDFMQGKGIIVFQVGELGRNMIILSVVFGNVEQIEELGM